MRHTTKSWMGPVLAIAVASAAVGDAVAQARLPNVLAWEAAMRGDDERDLGWPRSVAAASNDEIVVADASGPRAFLFRKLDNRWQLDTVAPLPGAALGMAYSGGRYVLSIRGEQGLIALEPPKLVQRRIGLPRGVVPGALASHPDGRLLVYDLAGERVLELNASGDPVRDVAVDGPLSALAVAPGGGFYSANAVKGTVLHHDAGGTVLAAWELPGDGPLQVWPVALAVEPGEGLAVLDRHACRIVFLDNQGRAVGSGSRRGSEPGLLLFPTALARLPDGGFVVADGQNGRVQVFRRSDRSGSP